MMRKGSSNKVNASPLVSLCKERKEHIRAAKYCRYDFVTSFVVYLESLLEIGNALNHYVENELVICGDYSHISLSEFDPPEKNEKDSSLESSTSSSDLESDMCTICHHLQCESEGSIDLFGSSQVYDEDCSSCKHISDNSYVNMKLRNRGSSNFSSNNTHHHHHVGMPKNEDHGHGQQHHDYSQRVNFGNKWENPKSGNWFPQQIQQYPFGKPMSFHDDRKVEHNVAQEFPIHVASNYEEPPQKHVPQQSNNPGPHKHGTQQNSPANTLPNPPPPPPPPQVSTWDFLCPFKMNYDVPFNNDHDVREAREREGIPDLEDENENENELQSPIVSMFDESEMESGMRHDGTSDSTFKLTGLNSSEDTFFANGGGIMICKEEPKTEEEDVWSEAEEETEELCSSCIGSSGGDTTPVANNSRIDIKEAIIGIMNEFKYLFDFGKEFSSFMEVGKLPHDSISTKLMALASYFLGMKFPSLQMSMSLSYRLLKPASKARIFSNADMRNNQGQFHTSFSDLSSTLEKLYWWEEKLYEEVMVEEKIRIPYDKMNKRLKQLDDRGSEFDKIDDTIASIKLLNSEINVAVGSINAASREIDGLRDNKLLPELHKLIEGLTRLWKVMSECHLNQFQAISKSKSHVHILDPGNMKKKKSSLKATLRLQKLASNWAMCFCNFINMHKAFVKHLNDWLMRQILQEQTEKEAEDGNGSLSLIDMGAPPIFIVCDEWYNAIHNVSESEVSKAISTFASSLHQLCEKQEEEKLLKVRVERLFKGYKQRLKKFCKKNGMYSHHCSSFFSMKTSEALVEAEVPLLNVSDEKLATSRERLVEERKRHQNVIRHVNDLASSCLQEGLSPIFEALGRFSLENLKTYEQLRFPNASSHE